jgi:diadenosine tetraphosphate (Ap4A) HIT family hydrolase
VSNEFEWLVLKKYRYWTLFLSKDQYYLGRAYAWLNRPGAMQQLEDVSEAELLELRKIMRTYRSAIGSLWIPDHMNYAWLGNEFESHQGHGHMHFIPRYKTERIFAGETFADGQWGNNYAPYPKGKVSKEILLFICGALQEKLIEVAP